MLANNQFCSIVVFLVKIIIYCSCLVFLDRKNKLKQKTKPMWVENLYMFNLSKIVFYFSWPNTELLPKDIGFLRRLYDHLTGSRLKIVLNQTYQFLVGSGEWGVRSEE